MTYVSIQLTPQTLRVEPQGKHRWLALKSVLAIPRSHVTGVEPGGHAAEKGPVGLRIPGTNLPGVYIAGTFWKFWGDPSRRVKSFWVRRHPDRCIRISFRNEEYDFAMVEVSEPSEEIARIAAWIGEGMERTVLGGEFRS